MTTFAALTASAAAPKLLPQATAEQRSRIDATAKKFEAQMISSMLQPMFEGLKTDGPFGGGEGEQTYRSFMVDAIGQQIAKSGGIGIAAPIAREMLKMQGLS